MISKCLRSRAALARLHTNMPMAPLRFFAEATASAGAAKGFDYQSFDDSIFYTPLRKVQFVDGKSTIFHNDNKPGEQVFVPWEVKMTTFKNFLGVFGFEICDYLFATSNMFYSWGALAFALNWFYRVYSYMGYAITKIDLHEDGKTVTVTLKTGLTKTIPIKDIVKKQNEKELV